MNIIDLAKELIATSKERLKNPFVGAFMSSWAVINWKPISIMLFSTRSVEDKIQLITDKHEFVQNSTFIPLLIAFIYVVIIPHLMAQIDKLIAKPIRERKHHKTMVKENDIINETQLVIAQNELEDAKAKNKDKTELNDKIKSLEGIINNKDTAIKEHEVEVEQIKIQLDTSKMDLLDETQFSFKAFKYTDLYNSFFTIATSVNDNDRFPENTSDNVIADYIKLGIVNQISNKTEYHYELSLKGSVFLKWYNQELVSAFMNDNTTSESKPNYEVVESNSSLNPNWLRENNIDE